MNKGLVVKISARMLSIILHLVAVAAIVYSFYPLAKWYFDAKPLWGVDFFYTATIVNMLKSNMGLPPALWGYNWFSGWPFLSNYPILHYYFIVPLTHYWPLIDSIKIWMLFSSVVFFIGCYALFFVLSHNRILSFLLTLASIYTVGLYGALMWGGSLPSYATQAFLPWVTFFVILFLQKNKTRFLLSAALLTGLSIWAHPQVAIAYIYPLAGLLFLFHLTNLKIITRLKTFFLFVLISFLISLPLTYPELSGITKVIVHTNSTNIAASTVRTPASIPGKLDAVTAFQRAQPLRLLSDTNYGFFIFLGVAVSFYLIGLVIVHRKKQLLEVLPYVIITGYFIFYVWIFSYGISIFHGGWYRLFWSTPVWLGMLCAAMWGSSQQAIKEKLNNFAIHFHISSLIISLILLVIGYSLVSTYSVGVKSRIVARSNPASAFPDIVDLHSDPVQFEQLKTQMVPPWLNPNDTNYRLYDADQTFNVWWNSLYPMPLTRGYLDPPQPGGYNFWLDSSLSQDKATGDNQLAGSFHYPKDVAFNNTLFLAGWNGIRYLEVHPGPNSYSPFPKELATDKYIINQQQMDFNKEKFLTGNEFLTYYELKGEYTSPILSATNAHTLGIVASESGYETVIRDIADNNISVNKLIPLKLGQDLDSLNVKDLSYIDGLILYDYKYQDKSRVFRLINDYISKGKKVFIDTGVEVAESNDNGPLPEIFPISKTFRQTIGTSWQLQPSTSDLTKDIDFTKFDPPLFDQNQWKVSFPQQESDLRANSSVLVTNNNRPLMISKNIGSGLLIWSGLNLPYHVSRNHNAVEVAFFRKILDAIIPNLETSLPTATYEVKFVNPQKRQITTSGSRGVLFKEQLFPGWHASLTHNNQTNQATIFKAGPTLPGFMYVPIPASAAGDKSTVEFYYQGSNLSWTIFIFAVLIIILCLDEILLGSRVLGRIRQFLWKKARIRLKGWWGQEDE